jgi:aryl-alcohol dehydrogenase-like predicted oxidoreductase
MRYKKFGKPEISVPEISVGTWAVGGRGWGSSDRAACTAAIRRMADLGASLIDTAPIYGNGLAEEIVGGAIRGMREKLILSTKCGIKLNSPPGAGNRDASRKGVIGGWEESCRRLGTEYIDIFFVHWPDPDTPAGETMGALGELREQGKIRYTGLSNYSVEQIEEALKYGPVDIIQPPFSMVEQKARGIMEWCHRRGIASMSYASLGAGILGGKIRSLPSFAEGDVRGGFYDYFREPKFSRVMELLSVMDRIALERKVPLSQIALNWAVQKDFVLTALAGVRTEEHARENCGAGDWKLSPAELALLDGEVARLFGGGQGSGS